MGLNSQCGKIEYGISRLGWLYCENCKSRFNNFILPKYYSEMINLSPSCYQSNGKMKIIKYGSTSFNDKTNLLLSDNNENNLRFYRKSSRNEIILWNLEDLMKFERSFNHDEYQKKI